MSHQRAHPDGDGVSTDIDTEGALPPVSTLATSQESDAMPRSRRDHDGNQLHGHSDDLLTAAMVLAGGSSAVVSGAALVSRCELRTDRHGQPYLVLVLRGADGGILDARWWRYPYPPERRPQVGQVCWVQARIDLGSGPGGPARQLTVLRARPAPQIPVEHFSRTTRQSLPELLDELEAQLAALPPDLQGLVRAVLSGDTLERFCTWPAAQIQHGAVRHGLLAHSLGVVRLALALGAAYGPKKLPYDADLVWAACLLHDVGKVRTLPAVAGTALPPEASHCDHITSGVLLVQAATATLADPLPAVRLDALLHAILAHHGRREWGAPIEPQTVEAWPVHLADLAESRLWGWSADALDVLGTMAPAAVRR